VKIVITGATSGLGREMALQYSEAGVHLGVVGRRETLLNELADACRAKGASVEVYVGDVTDSAAMKDLARCFVETAGGIDLVIANAGVGCPDHLSKGDPDPLTFVINVNVNGVLNTLLPFIPTMKEQGSGHLVTIASIAGARGMAGHTTYSASKAAVRMLMDGFAYELNDMGIATTTINPGFVKSEMTAKNRFPMPFLVETDAAARKMLRAIKRKKRVYTFPFPMRFAHFLLATAPRFVLGWLPRR
jgi:short-subunit dehydrogenase